MPLSEDEKRILSEIEANLYETDPSLAKEVASTTVYSASVRRLRVAAVTFFAGLAMVIFTLRISYWFSFIGFWVMLGAAMSFESSLRELSKVSVDQFSQSLSSRPLSDRLDSRMARFRDRLNNDYSGKESRDPDV